MKFHHLLALSSFVFLAACGDAPTAEEATAEDNVIHEEHDHEDAQAGAVQLDNGKRWAANVETTEGVNEMLRLVDQHDPSFNDGVKLKSDLETAFKMIFEKCTMTGEAHNQLHNFLIPIHHTLDRMGTAPTAAQLEELRAQLSTYDTYFQ